VRVAKIFPLHFNYLLHVRHRRASLIPYTSGNDSALLANQALDGGGEEVCHDEDNLVSNLADRGLRPPGRKEGEPEERPRCT
jgi:hypothetical protein